MEQAFATHRRNGLRYLTFPSSSSDGSVHIVDENGNNYGSWLSWYSFMKAEREPEEYRLGKIRLSGTVVSQ